jgi:signal transduction histidine kinase/ligand-binding sensor domain-containing protein
MFTRFQLWRATVGLSIVLSIAPEPGRAVDPDQSAASYIRTTFTVEDGLSSNVVNTIVQTRNGFLWIGTDAGLDRFDGRHFTPIYFRGPSPTPQGMVTALAEGLDGDLWIGTYGGLARIARSALDRFDRSLSVFYHPGPGVSDEITELHCTRDGVLWVGTEAGLYRFSNSRFETVIPGVYVSRIEESADGHLLVISSKGFTELDGTHVVPHPSLSEQLGVDLGAGRPPSGIQLYHVYQDRTGVLWFCTIKGLARRVNGSIERFQPYGGKGRGVYRVYEDPQGVLWVHSLTEVFRVAGTKLEPLVANMQIRYTSADREGNLWVGTNGNGLLRFRNRPIRTFSKADGLPNNIPMTVVSTRDGTLWVGNNCGGLSVFDGQRFKTYDERDGLANSCVWSLAEGKNGELWVGTWGGGLFRFADGHFVQFTVEQGLPNRAVRAITVAHDGSLWLATENGVSHMVNGQFHNYTTSDGLSSNRVVSVYQDRHGVIWVGTSRGINRMTGDRFVPVSSPHQIFDPRYISFGEDSSGELYALSAPKGVDRIEGNQLVEVNHDLDLLSMVASPSGELWFSGDKGIFRFSAAAFRQNQADPENPSDYAWFGQADGMTSTQCSIGTPNMARAPDGKLWVATVQGLAMLDLPHLSFDTAKPVIFIEDVTVGRTKQPAGRELVLPPGTHHVELRFDSISLSSPKTHFQYRMDGVDPVWLEADNSLTAVYTKIPVGTHAFRIRASNSAGVWDRSGISFPVIQKPYFYETGWFLLVATIAFILTLTGAYRLRLRQIHAQVNARLDERVLERTRIARDLHDTLLQSFQGLMFRLQAVRDLLPGRASEAMQALDIALERGDKAVAEGRDTVSDLREPIMGDSDIAQALTALGEELALQSGNGLVPRVLLEGKQRELNPMLRDEIYRIAREALRNAFRHARAQKIEAEITYSDSEFLLRVRDDGGGIDPEIANQGARAGHWGLPGMRERAKCFGGKLEVWSEHGAGTEIELSVPGAIAYGKSEPRRRFWLWRKKIGESDGQQS